MRENFVDCVCSSNKKENEKNRIILFMYECKSMPSLCRRLFWQKYDLYEIRHHTF